MKHDHNVIALLPSRPSATGRLRARRLARRMTALVADVAYVGNVDGVLEQLRSCRLLEGADQYRGMDALGEAILRGEGRAELLGEAGLPAGIRHPAAHC